MQPADFGSSYYQYHHHPQQQQNPNPNPNDLLPPPPAPLPLQTYASAPPFSSHHYSSSSSSDYSNFPSGYPSSYPQNPDPVLPNLPPTAPSYATNPNYQSFNPSPAQPPSNFTSFAPAPELGQAPYVPPPTTQHQQQQQPPYYHPSYDHQAGAAPNYNAPVIPPTQNPNSNPNSSFPTPYSGSYSQLGSSVPPVVYDPYESSSVKLDQRGGYLDGNSGGFGGQGGGFGRSQSDLSSDLYEKRHGSGIRYDRSGFRDDGAGDGVYAYDGGKVDPYGARGTSAKSSTWSSSFDDYGRAISNSSGKSSQAGSPRVVRAVPKVEVEQDTKNGVQKFRVKLLAEGGGQSSMDVLCQVGLDGIRMLDPNTNRTLRIYPLETVTRSDKTDSSTVAFWSKSSVDIEPRRIRLQSNSYTTNTILDTVTAAIIQFKEMGGKDTISNLSESGKLSEQYTERKKGLGDWMNLIKPGNEEKDHWVPDEAVKKCTACGTDFGAFVRRHHCRNCGDIFCDKCTHGRIALTADENAQPVRVCDRCLAEVTQRLSNAKESVSKPSRLHSHDDFAKKLQEEMDRNRKASSGSKSSEGSGKRMREVACPTCTVHLQVQVPASGSETIECGVCQHPFLVSAH